MTPATHSAQAAPNSIAGVMQARKAKFPPLEQITKPNLTTAEAAYFLDRKNQTLRAWACLENGPIRPRRIQGLLAWPTAEVKALAGVI